MVKDTHEKFGKSHDSDEKAKKEITQHYNPPPKAEPAPEKTAPAKPAWEDPPDGATVIAFKKGAPLLAQFRARHMSPEGGFYSKSSADGGFTILESGIDGWSEIPKIKWVQNV